MAETPERFVDLPDVRLYTRTAGAGEPLLVLHGGPALSHEYLFPGLAPLADVARVVFFDQRGCGRSSKPVSHGYGMAAMAADVEGLRTALGLGRVNVLGFSFGGMLAQEYALRYPSHVRRLIIAGAGPSGADINRRLLEVKSAASPRVREIVDRIEAAGPFTGDAYPPEYAAAVDEAYRPFSFHRLPGPPPEVAGALGKLSFDVYRILWGDRGEFRVTGILADWDRLEDLHRIAAPTLILIGRYDLTSVETVRDMGRRIPRSRVVVFEDSGHFMYLEEPEKFLSEVRGFLRAPA
jgi:proline-specific peptidase